MTTLTQTRGTLTARLILALLVLMLAASTIPQHALDRHGQDAIRAHEAVADLGHGGQYRCPDGKEYRIASLGHGDWGVEILYDGVPVTAFVTRDRAYLARAIEEDGCQPKWRGGHP